MEIGSEQLVTRIPLNLDLAGVFFHEAQEQFDKGYQSLSQLNSDLILHDKRVVHATSTESEDDREDAWVDVIQGVGGLEPICGKAIREFSVGQILLVAAAEAYANAVAHHSLGGAAAAQFDKLSPVGKWLFLPSVIGVKWKPDIGKKPLQHFAELVVRRNQLIHPREIRIRGILDIRDLVKRVGADQQTSSRDIESVRTMIREFSLKWKGSYGPDWLDPDKSKDKPPCFFGGDIEASLRLGRPGQTE
jgi:hypothetical protein